MPDWSYRTVLRPLMLPRDGERSRHRAVNFLRWLSHVPFGLRVIEFLGHMGPDQRLRTRVAGVELPGPIVLGQAIDPPGDALQAFSLFGPGLIAVRPRPEQEDQTAANLEHRPTTIPVCLQIEGEDQITVERLTERFRDRVAMFVVDHSRLVPAARGASPVLVRIDALRDDAETAARHACASGAAGIWVTQAHAEAISSLRAVVPAPAAIVAEGVLYEPADAWGLLAAGADLVVVSDGLFRSGPGLIKRCNEAIVATMDAPPPPEPLSLEAGRHSWFWALALGAAMFAGGVMAAIIGSTRVVMPYDESLCGLTRSQMISINPRLIPFMAHDRLSLAGTMLSIGILYCSLAWFGVRRGEHWARAAVVASATVGFFTFFYFLGFEYFDPFHAFVTAILTQFTLLCIALPPSPAQLPMAEWRETPAWRRGQWGQLLFIVIGVGLTGAGAVISFIGCTSVFVDTDLAYMRTTAAQLRISFDRLVPLIAHDRATLGGMLIANGVVIWLAAQWGMRAGARWLWHALAWSGNIAFAIAVAVHVVVGYGSPLHLAPAFLGWVAWNVALGLTRGWLAQHPNAFTVAGAPSTRPVAAPGRMPPGPRSTGTWRR